MAERMIDVQCSSDREMVIRIRPMRLRLLPEATMTHLRTANKEFLLAVRSFIDSAIRRMEQKEKAQPPSRRRVEVTREEAKES